VDDKSARVAAVPVWWHSIDLGDGVVTPGVKSPEFMEYEWWSFRLPGLQGKSFLDIGAWDGYFSFRAEREGADRVVALDHYVWMIDLEAQRLYYESCLREGVRAREFSEVSGLWRPEDLPGKAGFDCAHDLLASKVECVVADFMDMDLQTLGRFDVVLYAGMLYHMRHPMLALERVAAVTNERAIIETQAIAIGGMEELEVAQFLGRHQLRGDPTNWWAPTAPALRAMCESAGFSTTELLIGPPDDIENGEIRNYVVVVAAYK
jgi:tRNA (mo5U34)-methyltransferase